MMMEFEGSTLRLDASDREKSVLTSLRLPAGSASGGLLFPEGDTHVFLLFDEEELEVGDEVVDASDRRFTVISVRGATLRQRRVTALEVRPE